MWWVDVLYKGQYTVCMSYAPLCSTAWPGRGRMPCRTQGVLQYLRESNPRAETEALAVMPRV